MYPHSHLLAGLAAGSVAHNFGYLNYQEMFLVAGLAVLVDLDHYVYYAVKHKTLNFVNAWQAAIKGKEDGERTAVHHFTGLAIFSVFLIALWFFNEKWSLVLGLAYYSHFLLDYLPAKKEGLKFKLSKLDFKLSYTEIFLDIIFVVIIAWLIFI